MTFLSDTDPRSCGEGREWGIEEPAGRGTIVGTHAGVVGSLNGTLSQVNKRCLERWFSRRRCFPRKLGHLSSPRSHEEQKERTNPTMLPSDLHMHAMA